MTIDELVDEWERQDVQLSKSEMRDVAKKILKKKQSETSEFKDLLETFQMLRRK